MGDLQGRFEFADTDGSITYETIKGSCSCGWKYSVQRCSIALEMTICCADCGRIITIGKNRQTSF